MERQLRQQWAIILGIDADLISVDDSFLRIGGDSISAMRLVATAKRAGLSLTVADVLRRPRLCDLALNVHSANDNNQVTVESTIAFSLLKESMEVDWARSQASRLCSVTEERIEDMFPCTPLQEGLLAMTAYQSGNYIAQMIADLPADIDITRLQKAWSSVVKYAAILRTRIVDLPGQGLVQVVLDLPCECTQITEASSRPIQDMGLGKQLCYAYIDKTEGSACAQFILVIHHALYDGWSWPLLQESIEKAYKGSPLSDDVSSFQGFVQHLSSIDLDVAAQYWQLRLAGSQAAQFPTLPSAIYRPHATSVINQSFGGLRWAGRDFTATTIIRAAWAMTQARYTETPEAIFGAVVSGRQAPVPGIEQMIGPTIATVPLRVLVDGTMSVNQLLGQVQKEAFEMIKYEQAGLQRIRRLGEEAEQACRFQSIITVHPEQRKQIDRRAVLRWHTSKDLSAFSTYAIVLNCDLTQNGLDLQMNYDADIVDPAQAQRVVAQFQHILQQIMQPQSRGLCLRDLDIISPQDLWDIWAWNVSDYKLVTGRVHDLIGSVIDRQPGAPAVHAWDGKLTYAELDYYSTLLAHQLVTAGIQKNDIIPLCFEKSMWMAVSILGTMKAGGASVALDVNLPEERLRQIAQQVSAKLVLSSEPTQTLAHRLGNAKVLIVDKVHLIAPRSGPLSVLPDVTGTDRLYVVFTSGSTGKPKGIVVNHENFCSAFVYQHEALGYVNAPRVFEFCSYAFDVVWSNYLHTLCVGGCICVPSEVQRRGNICQAMRDLQVTFADLTPTVARLLDPAEVPDLHTLLLAGEAIKEADAEQWSHVPVVLNTYGPAETTIKTTIAPILRGIKGDPNIGRGYGGNTWLVDPKDYNRLVPIGCVGELVFDGPLVIQGYLNDHEKTAAAFINDPPWLGNGAPGIPGRHGRVYCTGDLVRYRPDGSLDFLGRKDDQVKIRGQRIELGEVEHHIRALLEVELQSTTAAFSEILVVAEVVQPSGADRSALVVFVVPPGAAELDERELGEAVGQLTFTLNESLMEVVPPAMIPSGYIPLRAVPVAPTGKTDRRELQRLGASLKLQELAAAGPERAAVAPQNPTEQALRSIWAEVLNLSGDSISVEVSFARLGGDSITAMQVVSRCRAQNISVTVPDILRLQNIRRISSECRPGISPNIDHTFVKPDRNSAWALSPVQQIFLDENPSPEAYNYCNLSFMFKMRRPVSLEMMRAAALAVTQRHEMLRARFRRLPCGGWEQYIVPFDPSNVGFNQHIDLTHEEVEHRVQRRQDSLDIEQGPVFAMDVFEGHEEGQAILMSAHHLVIDLVSWRVIWHDLQEFLDGAPCRQSPLSFQDWCAMQDQEAQSLVDAQFSLFNSLPPQISYWQLHSKDCLIETSKELVERLDAKTTSLLLDSVNEVSCSDTADVLIATLDHTFRQVFSDRAAPPIFFEGHGREGIDGYDTDIADTVGWFTTFHPIQMPGSDNMASAIDASRKIRRQMVGRARPFFTHHYRSRLQRQEMEVLLIYTGRFQQLEDGKSKFCPLSRPVRFGTASPKVRRFAPIEVTVEVLNGHMTITFTIDKASDHQERLHTWLIAFADGLPNADESLLGSGNINLV
ncbi:AMP-binding enzyme-4 [Elsinoe australis]|uniref:AMP-binding enzyme-4 n=1 Tax=Elsinoe australis TaxID=40998 RepID=A0A4U7AT39_9PEZI|nr:AMP-binding enzyme-4 [Elsinoe australis]